MNALINGLTLLLTIFVAMAIGIYAGYALLIGVLRLMGHRTEAASSGTASSGGVLVTSQAHSGD